MEILRVNGEKERQFIVVFTKIKRKVWAEYSISNTFTKCNYGSLKEAPLICKVLEQLSQ